MTFLKKFVVLFFALATGAPQLNAMKLEDNSIIAQLEKPGSSDFQIYQLLSEVTQYNPELYLPDEVTKIIAFNACEITKKLQSDCYKKYGAWLYSPDILLYAIERLEKSMSHTTLVTILKTCLSHSGKSLDQIQYYEEKTVLHRLVCVKGDAIRLDCLKILLLVAGDKAWDLIKMRDHNGCTVLDFSPCSSIAMVNELCNAAPNSKELWELICTKNDCGDTVLYGRLFQSLNNAADVVKKLLSYAPNREEAWLLISTRNWGGFILDLKLSNEEREILESYRPKEQ